MSLRSLPLLLALVLSLGPALGPALGAAPKRPKVKLSIDSRVSPEQPAPGGSAQVRLSLNVPEGIVLNRFPGITFTPAESEGLRFAEEKTHLGLEKMSEDPDEQYFPLPVPFEVAVEVDEGARGSAVMVGELKYYYCVKKSGYCAPARQQVRVSLPLGAR
jgi:hypothetical protein